MENKKLTRKQIIPIIIGVLTLVVLVASATYAYFSVSVGNTSNKTTIRGDIGGGTLGTITLDGGDTELYLGLTADDMSERNKGKVYYSSTEEGSRETSVNAAGKTTYTATLSGDETDSVMYACDYEFTVTSSGTALGKEATKDIELIFNGDINKKINLTGTDTVSGTWYGFKESNKERSFNAYLQLTNTEEEQNDIAGTNLSVEIENTKWNCYLSELNELKGEAYALLIENGDSVVLYIEDDEGHGDYYDVPTYDLVFLRSITPIDVGNSYNDRIISYVYTGFENSDYVPWGQKNVTITNVIFEDEIRPVSTAGWFSDLCVADNATCGILDLEKLNVSYVKDMSGMFADAGGYNFNVSWDLSIIENWDVSNVTDMSHMFSGYNYNGDLVLNLINWDVSNVTDMSYMFAWATDHGLNVNGLENWNISNVTNMSYMFEGSGLYNDLDLSGWDVSNVTYHENFCNEVYGSGTLTPPIWNN